MRRHHVGEYSCNHLRADPRGFLPSNPSNDVRVINPHQGLAAPSSPQECQCLFWPCHAASCWRQKVCASRTRNLTKKKTQNAETTVNLQRLSCLRKGLSTRLEATLVPRYGPRSVRRQWKIANQLGLRRNRYPQSGESDTIRGMSWYTATSRDWDGTSVSSCMRKNATSIRSRFFCTKEKLIDAYQDVPVHQVHGDIGTISSNSRIKVSIRFKIIEKNIYSILLPRATVLGTFHQSETPLQFHGESHREVNRNFCENFDKHARRIQFRPKLRNRGKNTQNRVSVRCPDLTTRNQRRTNSVTERSIREVLTLIKATLISESLLFFVFSLGINDTSSHRARIRQRCQS